MKPSIIAALASLAFLHEVRGGEAIQVFAPDAHGTVALDTAPAHVVDLIDQIKKSDMQNWLLSEEKGSRWLVSKVTIIGDALILVRLSDGNGAEDLLFDRDYEKHWTIIRRTPLGDAKPKDQRLGHRLSALPFPKPKAQQVGAGQPATRSESDSEGGDKSQPESERRSR
ncbi:MAG: hypothetical protein MI807_03630 [Verrucomicrobiales bacterium]|nr:hypothetical protein [Verrucomicrobiales bacterium]